MLFRWEEKNHLVTSGRAFPNATLPLTPPLLPLLESPSLLSTEVNLVRLLSTKPARFESPVWFPCLLWPSDAFASAGVPSFHTGVRVTVLGGVILTKSKRAWVQLFRSEGVSRKAGRWIAPVFQHWQSLLAWKMSNLRRVSFWQTHYKTHTSTSGLYVTIVSSGERRRSAQEWSGTPMSPWKMNLQGPNRQTCFSAPTLRSLSSFIPSDSWVSNTTRSVDASMRPRPLGYHHV